jgi:glycosyltransferase involved in cell wall biosynthesis
VNQGGDTRLPGPGRGKVRVAHLVLNVEAGGLEAVVLNLVARSNGERFEHRVVCLEGKGALAPQFRAIGIPVDSLAAPSRLVALARLLPWLRAWQPHVLHTHNAKPHLVGAMARALRRTSVLVHTKHGRNLPFVRRRLLWYHLAARMSDVIVAVSEDAAAEARELEHVSTSKLRVLYNGIDLASSPAPAASPAAAVCVARLHPIKDHVTLLRAARLVLDTRPDFRLALAGEGSERGRIEGVRAELGLAAHVSLLGHRSDVRDVLAASSLFVLASQSEGISLSVLEAMAASLPVVTTAVGGNNEVVAHGDTGLLVPPSSPEALARAILALLEDPGRARALGVAGRRRVERIFSLESMVARYEALYLELLARRQDGA